MSSFNPGRPLTQRERDISTIQIAFEMHFPGCEPLGFRYAVTWLKCAPLDKVLEIMETAAHHDQNVSPLRSPAGFIFTKLKRYQVEHDDVGAAVAHWDENGQRC